MDDYGTLRFRLNWTVKQKLEYIAQIDGKSVSEVIRTAIIWFLGKEANDKRRL